MQLTKGEYIVNSLSKISHKKWELYVISRIFHLVSDMDIEFVCQQLIRKKNGGRYLVDLFLPQLDIYLEIDEAHHFPPEHQYFDRLRKREILDATNLEEHRIAITSNNSDKAPRELTKINESIDNFIEIIKLEKITRLQNGNFEKWDMENKYNPQKHIENGYISSDDNVVLRREVDVISLFGTKYKGYQKGVWNIKGTKKMVWFPRLYKHNEWTNELSDGGSKIYEKKSDGSSIEYIDSGQTRVVFGHYRNILGQTVYKYVGEFEINNNETTNNCRVYKRISKITNLQT